MTIDEESLLVVNLSVIFECVGQGAIQRILSRCLLSLWFLFIAGCSVSDFGVDGDPDLAQQTLTEALDAWKSKQLPALARRDPPIRFSDDDQVAGCQLIDYEIESTHPSQFLPFKNVIVSLDLKDIRGKSFNKRVSYQITTDPGRCVLRSNN